VLLVSATVTLTAGTASAENSRARAGIGPASSLNNLEQGVRRSNLLLLQERMARRRPQPTHLQGRMCLGGCRNTAAVGRVIGREEGRRLRSQDPVYVEIRRRGREQAAEQARVREAQRRYYERTVRNRNGLTQQ
jgi:hypothetical protein